jgi:hypothetical protein
MNSLIIWVRDHERQRILYGEELGITDRQWVEWARRVQGSRRLWNFAVKDLFPAVGQYRRFRAKLATRCMVEKTRTGYRLTPGGHALVARLVRFGNEGLADRPPGWWARERERGRILLCEVKE